ncbi:MAG: hypothetical protein HY832_03845 [Candidatus Aenigmarchaeota archaeon]|nr:hypothetical protein [Candidatus Aenigmarchaeota archaeon]
MDDSKIPRKARIVSDGISVVAGIVAGLSLYPTTNKVYETGLRPIVYATPSYLDPYENSLALGLSYGVVLIGGSLLAGKMASSVQIGCTDGMFMPIDHHHQLLLHQRLYEGEADEDTDDVAGPSLRADRILSSSRMMNLFRTVSNQIQ